MIHRVRHPRDKNIYFTYDKNQVKLVEIDLNDE
jgi:hypothetical protein